MSWTAVDDMAYDVDQSEAKGVGFSLSWQMPPPGNTQDGRDTLVASRALRDSESFSVTM